MNTDLTLIVTAHDETAVCGPTMRSADLAVDAAREAGYIVQTIIGLDAATEATTAYFHQSRFDHWERRILQEGDLGRVRNALLPETDGRYVAFLDADDLFSENWLAEGIAALDAAAERASGRSPTPSSTSSSTATGRSCSTSTRTRRCSRRTTSTSVTTTTRCAWRRGRRTWRSPTSPGRPQRPVLPGLPVHHRVAGRGWRHVVVRDTIIFKRRRDFSLVTESNARKSIVRSLRRWRSTASATWADHSEDRRRWVSRRWPPVRRADAGGCGCAPAAP